MGMGMGGMGGGLGSAEEAYAQAVLAQQQQNQLRRGISQPQLNTAQRAFEGPYSPVPRQPHQQGSVTPLALA